METDLGRMQGNTGFCHVLFCDMSGGSTDIDM